MKQKAYLYVNHNKLMKLLKLSYIPNSMIIDNFEWIFINVLDKNDEDIFLKSIHNIVYVHKGIIDTDSHLLTIFDHKHRILKN